MKKLYLIICLSIIGLCGCNTNVSEEETTTESKMAYEKMAEANKEEYKELMDNLKTEEDLKKLK